MMPFPEQVTDLLGQCHCAARTIAMARTLQERQRLSNVNPAFVVDDVIEALVRELAVAEKKLLDLLSASGGSVEANGYHLSVKPNDRRAHVRPVFVLHKNTDVPAGRRQSLAVAS